MYYNGPGGNSVAQLTSYHTYPESPTKTVELTSKMQSQSGYGNNYVRALAVALHNKRPPRPTISRISVVASHVSVDALRCAGRHAGRLAGGAGDRPVR